MVDAHPLVWPVGLLRITQALTGMIPDIIGWRVQLTEMAGDHFVLDPEEHILHIPRLGWRGGDLPPVSERRDSIITQTILGLRQIAQVRMSPSLAQLSPLQAMMWMRAVAADQDWFLLACLAPLRSLEPHWVHNQMMRPETRAALDQSYEEFWIHWADSPVRQDPCDGRALDARDAFPGAIGLRTPTFLRYVKNMTGLSMQVVQDWMERERARPLAPLHAAYMAQMQRDHQTIRVNNVAFRDAALARRIFS